MNEYSAQEFGNERHEHQNQLLQQHYATQQALQAVSDASEPEARARNAGFWQRLRAFRLVPGH